MDQAINRLDRLDIHYDQIRIVFDVSSIVLLSIDALLKTFPINFSILERLIEKYSENIFHFVEFI